MRTLDRISPAPKTGWSSAPSARRVWIGRGILLAILLVQAALSLQLSNGAFEDEALYLYAGHLQLDYLRNGTPIPIDFASFFSGSPSLYPVLAALVDSVFGLRGARVVSLLFLLGSTALLYALTRRLFNERVALCAAAVFAVCPSAVFVGSLATYDALAVFLLALAAWIVVRTGPRGTFATCAAAVPVMALVVAVKYASLLFLPTIAALAVLAAFPYRRWSALWRGVFLPVLTGVVLAMSLVLGDAAAWRGVQSTTMARPSGADEVLDLLVICCRWAGPLLALAALGAVLYVRRDRMGELPVMPEGESRGRVWRVLLVLVLCGSALLAPAYQLHLQTEVSLHKHIGYGLLFAAPVAGIGLSRVVGAHFRHPQLGILIWVALLIFGITHSRGQYLSWPDPLRLVAALETQLAPGRQYLVENSWPAQYYLRGRTQPSQWTSTYGIDYQAGDGRLLSGRDGYLAAIDNSHFDVIVLDGTRTPELDEELTGRLRLHASYRLLAALPYQDSTRAGTYQIWVKSVG